MLEVLATGWKLILHGYHTTIPNFVRGEGKWLDKRPKKSVIWVSAEFVKRLRISMLFKRNFWIVGITLFSEDLYNIIACNKYPQLQQLGRDNYNSMVSITSKQRMLIWIHNRGIKSYDCIKCLHGLHPGQADKLKVRGRVWFVSKMWKSNTPTFILKSSHQPVFVGTRKGSTNWNKKVVVQLHPDLPTSCQYTPKSFLKTPQSHRFSGTFRWGRCEHQSETSLNEKHRLKDTYFICNDLTKYFN